MPIKVEYHTITGMLTNPLDGLIKLNHTPDINSRGVPDISVDAIGGSGLLFGKDFGLTGGNLDHLTYNLEESSIRILREKELSKYGEGSTGVELRIQYTSVE